MVRRTFVTGSSLSVLAALLSEASDVSGKALKQPGPSPLQLTKLNQSEHVRAAYNGSKGPGSASVPYVYAYYDVNLKKFINPLDITPTKPAGAYTLEATLHAFNMKLADQDQYKKLKNQVQLGFNATAPLTSSEKLTWLFMNAISVFGAKSTDKAAALTKFKGDSGVPLQASPKITVAKGIVNLQVTAFGQRQDGFWRKFLDIMAAAVKSPIVDTALKGFGIPSLAGDALTFVDHAVDVFADEEKLVPLWQTGSLEFAIHKDADAIFKMNPGLWAAVDSPYAQSTNFLEGHTIDLTYESFRLLDKDKKSIDANYLVTDLKMTS